MRKFFLCFVSFLLVFAGLTVNANKVVEPAVNAKNILINEDAADFDFSGTDVVSAVNVPAKKRLVYAGGTPIGITLKNKGLIIIGKTDIITEFGLKSAVKNSDLKNGDVLIAIEGREINTAGELALIINEEQFKGKVLNIVLKRAGKEVKTILEPQLDAATQKYRAGLWVREETYGIGTLTYIKQDDLRFGALGHPISDPDTGEVLQIKGGLVSGCNITGIIKGERGRAGELKGTINKREIFGAIDKNNLFGIFGKYTVPYSSIYGEALEVMPHKDIRPGKAKIITTLDGGCPKEYDIEIIKSLNQAKPADKNLVIRVIDKELLAKTGGIVQGMSGSPIIQKGKLCGAVTHVFVNDPTKGYGVFIDYMLEN